MRNMCAIFIGNDESMWKNMCSTIKPDFTDQIAGQKC